MDVTQLRIGKLAPRHDDRTLRLANYLAAASLPPPPASLTYASRIKRWGMYANDRYGDCTYAGAAHLIRLYAALAGGVATPAEKTIIRDYLRMSPNDQGCVMLDVLNDWRKNGIGGHHIFAFAALNGHDHDHIKQSVVLFGGAYVGVSLPKSAQNQTGPGKVWDKPAGGWTGDGKPGTWGGHCIPIVGFDPLGVDVITWDAVQRVSWAFLDECMDESYAVLTSDWKHTPKAPGIDFTALQADLAQIGRPA